MNRAWRSLPVALLVLGGCTDEPAATSAAELTGAPGIARGAPWRAWDRGGEPASWRAPAYDDGAWLAGPGPLGYGEDYVATQVAPGPVTTYFRTTFTARGAVRSLAADVMYDDGLVAYLDGVEIARVGLPAGAIGPATPAVGHEARDTYDSLELDAFAPLVTEGTHVLAVEVHQSPPASSDLVFDLALRIGATWTQQPTGTLDAVDDVAFVDARRGWAVAGARILRTVDGGATWSPQPMENAARLRAIDFGDANHGWIVGDAGAVLRTYDGGEHWTIETGPTADFDDVDFVDAMHGWRSAAGGRIDRTIDGGETWTTHAIPTVLDQAPVTRVAFVDARTGWAIAARTTDGPVVFRTIDGGLTWTAHGPAPAADVLVTDLAAIDARTAWITLRAAADPRGEHAWVTRDAGATWSEAPPTANDRALDAIAFVDADRGWATGAAGSIIATVDGGRTWQIQRRAGDAPGPSYRSLHALDGDHLWIAGSDGTLVHTTTGGWRAEPVRPAALAADPAPSRVR